MSIRIDSELCTACGACVDVCPFAAMDIVDEKAVANEQCNLCGACVDACPVEAITIETTEGLADDSHRGVWVFAEQRRGCIAGVSFELLSEGRRLAGLLNVPLSAVLFGHGLHDLTADMFAHGADRVYLADAPEMEHFTDDLYGGLLTRLIQEHKPEIVLCGATAMGRSFFPKTAAALKTGLTADCTGLEIQLPERLLRQTRPAFGGNIMATILCPAHRPQMATVRPRVMKTAPAQPGRSGEVVTVSPDGSIPARFTRVLETVVESGEKLNLAEVEVIVAGGRGLGSADGFKLLHELAELLGGAVGASRGAVDSAWIPYAHQVGQTGKTVAPRLYIACGISGAVQHLVGMQSADCVVAVNNDPNAPIFSVADYGIVGNVYEVLPALIRQLKGA